MIAGGNSFFDPRGGFYSLGRWLAEVHTSETPVYNYNRATDRPEVLSSYGIRPLTRRFYELLDQTNLNGRLTQRIFEAEQFGVVKAGVGCDCSETLGNPQRPGLYQPEDSGVNDGSFHNDPQPSNDASPIVQPKSPCRLRGIIHANEEGNAEEEGLHASEASTGRIGGIAVDSSGYLFFSEEAETAPLASGGHRVRMIDDDQRVWTIAGTGELGYEGDGGPASEAQLAAPTRIAFGWDESLYIIMGFGGGIRKVNPDDTIMLLAGSNYGYVDLPSTHPVMLSHNAHSIAVDNQNNVLVGECCNPRVQMIAPDFTLTTIVNQNGTPGFDGDGGPAIDAKARDLHGLTINPRTGNIYLADTRNHRIRKIDPLEGTISTVAGSGETPRPGEEGSPGWDIGGGFEGDGGPATEALLHHPMDVAIGIDGEIYVADSDNGRVRVFIEGGAIETFAGGGEEWPANYDETIDPLNAWMWPPHGAPRSLTVGPDGSLYVASRYGIAKIQCPKPPSEGLE